VSEVIAPKGKIGHNSVIDAQGGDAVRKQMKFTQWKKYTPRADRPKEEASEGAHGGGLGGLSRADYQMPARERTEECIVVVV
jgi:hypothetical protein